MREGTTTKIFTFQGGYATDLPPMVRDLTFLDKAENALYSVSGSVPKVGGTLALNGTVLSGAPSIMGTFDFWTAGTGGTFTQYFVAVTSDGRIYNFGTGTTATDITGAVTITANSIPTFVQFNDTLFIFTSAADTPISWAGIGNAAAASGSPPVGRFGFVYNDRLWIGATKADPSRLYYCAAGDPTTWTGGDAGSIYFNRNDGDRLMGGIEHKGRGVVFKGPNKGSLHELSGTSPSTYARTKLTEGIALQTPNAIIPVGDDVWFGSDQGSHSLAATEKFGNFTGAFLTRFLTGFFRTEINRTRLANVWGFNYSHKSAAGWTFTPSGGSANNLVLGLSYIRTNEEGLKPFTWTGRTCQSAGIRINPTTMLRELVFGGNDGFIDRQDTTNYSLRNATAYNYRVRTPQLILTDKDPQGNPIGDQPSVLFDIYLRSRPVGNYNVTISFQRDNEAPESYTFNQGSSAAIWDTSVFGTGAFGGSILQTAYPNNVAKVSGRARSIRLDIQQGGLNQQAEIYEVGVEYNPTAKSRSTDLNY